MDARLTAAGRVQRRLKAGRPALKPEVPKLMEALYRAMLEMDRAREIMADEGLDAKWLGVKFGFMRNDGDFEFRGIPEHGALAPFFADLEGHEGAIFAGLLWILRDQEVGKTLVWVSPFSSNEQANDLLLGEASETVKHAEAVGLAKGVKVKLK